MSASSSATVERAPNRCPLCGYAIARNPKECYRCGALHHGSCWEYLPGCAIYGCGPGDLPDTRGWGRLARLWRWRAHAALLGVQATWVAAAGCLALLAHPPLREVLQAPVLQLAAAAVGSLLAALTLTWVALYQGALGLPEDRMGNTRVRRTLEYREVGAVPRRPWRTGLLLALLAAAAVTALAWSRGGAAEVLETWSARRYDLGAALAGAVLGSWALVRLTVRPLSRLRIQARRLSASVKTMARLRRAGMH